MEQAHAQTVQLRVQVVDMKSFTLDLVVPTYLPARDLTARIARDAGLESHWSDGRRRLYWLRARGRLLTDDESLEALGVVPGELVYLLPEPPAGSGIYEQKPDYPETHNYAGAGILTLLGSIALVCAWSVAWGIALSYSRSLAVVLLPGLALGFLATSLARHTWGGRGGRVRVAVTGLLLFVFVAMLAVAGPVFFVGLELTEMLITGVPGVFAGMVGVLVGWLAWWGPVEPLPAVQEQDAAVQDTQSMATVQCAVCGLAVGPEVRQECPHRCGRWFHSGCYEARMSVYRGDPAVCGICNQPVP